MVSAKEVAQVAVYGGPLEKKGRTGWKKRYFYLTSSQWMYYDANDASSPSFVTNATDIVQVEEINGANDALGSQSYSSLSQKGFCFAIVVGKKRSELRAATEEERDGWIGALTPFAKEIAPLSSPHAHHPKSRSKSELIKVAEYLKQQLAFQKKKQCTATEATTILAKKFPHLSQTELETWGQTLLDAKLIIPVGTSTISFARHSGTFSCDVKKKTARISASERAKISDIMSNINFDAKGYAEQFLKKNAPDKIEEHCETLLDQKEAIIEELKDDICANYRTFLSASSEIRTMESSVLQMKTLLHDCKQSLMQLQNVSFTSPQVGKKTASSGNLIRSPSKMVITHDEALLELEYSLEMFLFEQDYESFTNLVLESKAKHQNPLVTQLLERYTRLFVDQVTTSAPIHRINRDLHLAHLIKLGKTKIATDMCLSEYSSKIVSELRAISATGQTLHFVLELSRAFFTTLLMCYEDYLFIFEGQNSAYFAALAVWVATQVSQFATEVALHIFDCTDPVMSWLVKDPQELKATSKSISSSLRYVYFGARQLELAGLSITSDLSTHFGHLLEIHVKSYAKAIKVKVRDEVKRERWEMVSIKIRDDKADCEVDVILTKSAKYFYGLLQQFLRDIQKLFHPTFPSSQIPRVQMTILYEVELVLIQYFQDIKSALENPKTMASVKYSHVVAMLSMMRYIQKDSLPRVLNGLASCIPASQVEKSDFGSKFTQLWAECNKISVDRMAQALLFNCIRWNEINLSSEALPTDGNALFITSFLNELKSVGVEQLEAFGEHEDITLHLISSLFHQMIHQETWWKACESKQKMLGYGGTSQFIAEIRIVTSRVASIDIERTSTTLVEMLKQAFTRQNSGKDVAPDAWYIQYAERFT
ncbi:hypothetical protein THRCLA_11619 [Thraustotheca clavata]|uniref:Exocyst complex component 8 n=1 Tax=Thraustotheca clavata TaxID=74557 RepID=A0A1V9Y774_9STRA|nr:hypothetical protein THRCLA_11619 [Thraustotheca clavata]